MPKNNSSRGVICFYSPGVVCLLVLNLRKFARDCPAVSRAGPVEDLQAPRGRLQNPAAFGGLPFRFETLPLIMYVFISAAGSLLPVKKRPGLCSGVLSLRGTIFERAAAVNKAAAQNKSLVDLFS